MDGYATAVAWHSDVDFKFENHGSIFLLRPLNDDAEEHLAANVSEEAQWFGGALVVEPRYVACLAAALRENGWTVE